jgi:thiol-disulfide isomerase/thioredoxin
LDKIDVVPSLVDSSSLDSALQRRVTTVPRLIGAFLLATAWLKILGPVDAPSVQSYDIPYWVLIAGIQLELVLGLLLSVGVRTPWIWSAAVALIASFAGISLIRALAGLESCGCFGAIRVNPWITLGIDLAILVAFCLLRRRFFVEAKALSPPYVRGAYFLSAVMGASSLFILEANRPERLTASTPLLADERLVLLDPSEWNGKPFPLSPYLDPKVGILAGRWIVVLYHHDCPKCQEALPEYARLASETGLSGPDGILAVEVPPFGARLSISNTGLSHARLSEAREWFVEAPVEIVLEDGVVIGASLELPSIDQAKGLQISSEASE